MRSPTEPDPRSTPERRCAWTTRHAAARSAPPHQPARHLAAGARIHLRLGRRERHLLRGEARHEDEDEQWDRLVPRHGDASQEEALGHSIACGVEHLAGRRRRPCGSGDQTVEGVAGERERREKCPQPVPLERERDRPDRRERQRRERDRVRRHARAHEPALGRPAARPRHAERHAGRSRAADRAVAGALEPLEPGAASSARPTPFQAAATPSATRTNAATATRSIMRRPPGPTAHRARPPRRPSAPTRGLQR